MIFHAVYCAETISFKYLFLEIILMKVFIEGFSTEDERY